MTWRLDKGLWVYLDGSFRGVTKVPTTLPKESGDTPKRFLIGRKTKGPDYAGAQFGFGSLAVYTRYLNRDGADKVFGGRGLLYLNLYILQDRLTCSIANMFHVPEQKASLV